MLRHRTTILRIGLAVLVLLWIVATEVALRPLLWVGLEPDWLGAISGGLFDLLAPINFSLSAYPVSDVAADVIPKPVWYGMPAYSLMSTGGERFGVILLYVCELLPLSVVLYPRRNFEVIAQHALTALCVSLIMLGYEGYVSPGFSLTLFGAAIAAVFLFEWLIVMPLAASFTRAKQAAQEF